MLNTPDERLPPRILVVMPEQWPRSLLRAELIEAGYDVLGARDRMEADHLLEGSGDRGPVRMVLIDQAAVSAQAGDAGAWGQLAPGALHVLLASGLGQVPDGPWSKVLRRPLRLGEIVAAVSASVPLSESGGGQIG